MGTIIFTVILIALVVVLFLTFRNYNAAKRRICKLERIERDYNTYVDDVQDFYKYLERKHEADLIGFGKYLLSDERRQLYEQTESELSLAERLSQVSDADLGNWKDNR